MFRRIVVSAVAAMIATGVVSVTAIKRYEEVVERQRERDEIGRLRFLLDIQKERYDLLREKLRDAQSLEYRQPRYMPTEQAAAKHDEVFESTKADVMRRIDGK